jgi:hypothetical protein
MIFQELDNLVIGKGTTGYTPSYNDLDDLLLRDLPAQYYCFYRFIWRKSYGWRGLREPSSPVETVLGVRDIAKGAGIPASAVGRIAWFFHVAQLIQYTPGVHNQTNSQFLLLPNGLPDLSTLGKIIQALRCVLDEEKGMRRNDRNLRYTNNAFLSRIANVWKEWGGQLAEPVAIQQQPGAVQ